MMTLNIKMHKTSSIQALTDIKILTSHVFGFHGHQCMLLQLIFSRIQVLDIFTVKNSEHSDMIFTLLKKYRSSLKDIK